MAHVRLEISNFAELLRKTVNRTQPVFADKFSYGKGMFSISLEVAAQRLETVRAEGSIVIECELNAEETFIAIVAQIPKLYLEIPCTVLGGWFFIRDGTRSLEIFVDGGVTGDVQFADAGNGSARLDSVTIDLRGFQIKFHVLPAWVERRLQRPIEKAIEDALEQLICHTIPVSLTTELVSPGVPGSQVTESVETGLVHDRQPGLLSRFAYKTGYYVAFGVAYPALLIARSMPTDNAAGQGLRDGAAAAQRDVRRLDQRWAPEIVGVADVVGESTPLLTRALESS